MTSPPHRVPEEGGTERLPSRGADPAPPHRVPEEGGAERLPSRGADPTPPHRVPEEGGAERLPSRGADPTPPHRVPEEGGAERLPSRGAGATPPHRVPEEGGAERLPSRGAGATGWLTQKERGALAGIRLVFWLATVFGRWPARQFIKLVAAWYARFDEPARTASRDWLRRVHGREPTARDVRRHIGMFAQAALDRIFLLQGRTKAFEVTRTGNHHLEQLVADGQGAVLLGAHLGSFEAMRLGAEEEDFPVWIVGHFENARMINALLERIAPDMAGRVIHAGSDPIGFALEVKRRVDEGGLVAILGDRVGLNDKSIDVPFLGEPAPFPTGPFLLASTLRCPVYLVFGLYTEPNRYSLFCEPFAERITLPRGRREQALRDVVERYASRLEAYARRAPDNWFNFYDFWDHGDQ